MEGHYPPNRLGPRASRLVEAPLRRIDARVQRPLGRGARGVERRPHRAALGAVPEPAALHRRQFASEPCTVEAPLREQIGLPPVAAQRPHHRVRHHVELRSLRRRPGSRGRGRGRRGGRGRGGRGGRGGVGGGRGGGGGEGGGGEAEGGAGGAGGAGWAGWVVGAGAPVGGAGVRGAGVAARRADGAAGRATSAAARSNRATARPASPTATFVV